MIIRKQFSPDTLETYLICQYHSADWMGEYPDPGGVDSQPHSAGVLLDFVSMIYIVKERTVFTRAQLETNRVG